jgi:hypothetical protein
MRRGQKVIHSLAAVSRAVASLTCGFLKQTTCPFQSRLSTGPLQSDPLHPLHRLNPAMLLRDSAAAIFYSQPGGSSSVGTNCSVGIPAASKLAVSGPIRVM